MKGITLSELAIELSENKSKLAYYVSKGLLKPTAVIGKTQVFDKVATKKRLRRIKTLSDKGYKLKEIRILLK